MSADFLRNTMQTNVQLPIPRIYWDTLQSSLHAEVKRLAKEVARTLHQPEQPLLKAIQQNTLGAYLFEESNSELLDIQDMRCKHLVSSFDNPSVLCHCNQPILLGAGDACPTHLRKEKTRPNLTKLRIVKSAYGETFWIDDDNNIRQKGDLKLIGKYNPESKYCLIIKVDE